MFYDKQDTEKEVRKEVDEAIAQAKVWSPILSLALWEYFMNLCLYPTYLYLVLQESPMPDPSELFSNVYAKGLGTEVKYFIMSIWFWRESNNYRTHGSLNTHVKF